MNIESLVGKTVRLTLAGEEMLDRFIRPRITSNNPTFNMVAIVNSVDQLGIWIEVAEYPVYDNVDRKKEHHPALVLIRFEYISSIVHFPNLEEGDDKGRRIGFVVENEST